jgi:hypothetical protein
MSRIVRVIGAHHQLFNTGLKLGIGGCPLLVQRLQLD